MNEWILCDGASLPEPLVDVLLVYTFDDDDPTIDMGFMRANGTWFLTGTAIDLIEIKPTHWMPLPPLPVIYGL